MEATIKLDMRFGNYGVKHAVIIGEDTSEFKRGDTLDLVKFAKNRGAGGEYNYTIGRWRHDGEGYCFESIGNRLFTELDADDLTDLWPMLRTVQDFLDSLYS